LVLIDHGPLLEDITGDCFLGLAMCGINTLVVLGLFVAFG